MFKSAMELTGYIILSRVYFYLWRFPNITLDLKDLYWVRVIRLLSLFCKSNPIFTNPKLSSFPDLLAINSFRVTPIWGFRFSSNPLAPWYMDSPSYLISSLLFIMLTRGLSFKSIPASIYCSLIAFIYPFLTTIDL